MSEVRTSILSDENTSVRTKSSAFWQHEGLRKDSARLLLLVMCVLQAVPDEQTQETMEAIYASGAQ